MGSDLSFHTLNRISFVRLRPRHGDRTERLLKPPLEPYDHLPSVFHTSLAVATTRVPTTSSATMKMSERVRAHDPALGFDLFG
jgi:hypothetical protein